MSWKPPWGINQGAKAGGQALKVRLRTAESSLFHFCSLQKERFSKRKRNLAHYTMAGFASFNALERFQSSCALFGSVKGAVFLRKTPLDCVVPVYSNSGTAVRPMQS
jgi:hypothetical protein